MKNISLIALLICSLNLFAQNKEAKSTGNTDSDNKISYTIFTGKLNKQEHVNGIVPERCLEDDVICMNGYYIYHINVNDVIAGEQLESNIKAANYQHAEYIFRSGQTALFVVSRVKNEKYDHLLGTPFAIEEFSQLKSRHCLANNASKYMPLLDEDDSRCFHMNYIKTEENKIADSVRRELFSAVIKNVEAHLKKNQIFKNYDETFWSDGLEIIDTEEQDEKCDHVDLDLEDRDSNCDYSKFFSVLKFEVVKGQGNLAKDLFIKELDVSKLNLKPFDIRYQVIENENGTDFIVHYKY